jgi:hypothetical protein
MQTVEILRLDLLQLLVVAVAAVHEQVLERLEVQVAEPVLTMEMPPVVQVLELLGKVIEAATVLRELAMLLLVVVVAQAELELADTPMVQI